MRAYILSDEALGRIVKRLKHIGVSVTFLLTVTKYLTETT
jgi:hypothetical protein